MWILLRTLGNPESVQSDINLQSSVLLLEIRPMAYLNADSTSDENGDLTRRERRKLEVHVRILEAAVELFQQRGIDATKVLEICESADVAHKTFFNHFASKGHLLREIARHGVDQVLTSIETACKQQTTTGGRIHQFFSGLAEHADEAGPMHGELLSEIVAIGHESGEEADSARRFHAAFGAIVRDGLARGDVTRRHSAETLTEMLMGAYYALMFNWAHLEDYPLGERALETARFLTDSMTLAAEDR